MANRYDIFIFVWQFTFLPFNLDIPILKRLNKTLIRINCGDDVRYRPIHEKIFNECYRYSMISSRNEKERQQFLYAVKPDWYVFLITFITQKMAEKFNCIIVSRRNQATFQGKSVFFHLHPQAEILPAYKVTNSIPRIIHAPSNRLYKGTSYVLDAIDILKEEGLAFEFELIEHKPNTYVLQQMKKSDILIDQSFSWYGRVTVEAMAAGCAVVTHIRKDVEGTEWMDVPTLPFERDVQKLASVLRELITNADKRQHIMNKSYDFYKQYYSYESVGKWLVGLLNGEGPKVEPLPNQKELAYKYAENAFQRFIIKHFW